MIRIPMLVPGLEYNFETIVECVSDLGISDQLYVFITKDKVPTDCPATLSTLSEGYYSGVGGPTGQVVVHSGRGRFDIFLRYHGPIYVDGKVFKNQVKN